MEKLVDLACTLSQQDSFDEILRVVTEKAATMLDAHSALILMINPRTQDTVKTIYDYDGGIGTGKRVSRYVHSQVTGWVIKYGQSFLSADVKEDHRLVGIKWGDADIQSVMCAPLQAEGNVLGTILLLNRSTGRTFDEDDLAYLEKLTAISAPYLRNVQRIQEYFEPPLPEGALAAKYEKLGLMGGCRSFVELLQAVEAAARCDVRVLLEGESGTGKELIAQAIHRTSMRSSGPFVAIDCGAIPPKLIESELFGHIKGAFTGATSARVGLVEEANHGTLFVDEVNNLPHEMQAKLMRMLQENEIRPVGSNKPRRVDVRIISASSVSLKKLVQQQAFREDLFYRVYVYPIHVPSLADRSEDIPMLAHHFLKKFGQAQGKVAERFDADLLAFLKRRAWPGNIRELENLVERLVTLGAPDLNVMGPQVLPVDLRQEYIRAASADGYYASESLSDRLAQFEEQLIREALALNDWNRSRAARMLKLPVPTLRYKLRKLGIEQPVRELSSDR